jgi:hypothetical protein
MIRNIEKGYFQGDIPAFKLLYLTTGVIWIKSDLERGYPNTNSGNNK